VSALQYHSLIVAAVLGAVAPAAVVAQMPEQDAAADEQAPQYPAPGEEVMRPTQRGLRLTPDMARGIGRLWMQEQLWKDMDLTEDQERQIADRGSRRLMEMGHREGPEAQAAFECLFATLMNSQGKVTAENCREFGEKLQPLSRISREFVDGVAEDARGILNEQQFKQLESQLEKQRRGLDRLDRRLANYREGRVEGAENPFDELEVEEQAPGQPKVDARVRSARRSAEAQIRQTTTWDWSGFLTGAGLLFKFDDAQKAKGQALLAEYRKKAEAIQTPEWKERMQKNRMMVTLQWQLGDVPKGPWLRKLDQEWHEANRPMEALTREFHGKVLALATAQQRASALDSTQELFGKHGLTLDPADAAELARLLQ
jgi:hypothetical protein